jgi:ABC-type branched-subunit amino acid transport system permease subunit
MDNEIQQVIITDIKMPFFSMVVFMVKWALAAIPALIVIGIIFAALGIGLNMVLGMLGMETLLTDLMEQAQQQ